MTFEQLTMSLLDRGWAVALVRQGTLRRVYLRVCEQTGYAERDLRAAATIAHDMGALLESLEVAP